METQTRPPDRLSTQPLQPDGSLTAQERAKRAACVWRRKPTDTTKPANPRTEERTQKPDAPKRQADFESRETDGSMVDLPGSFFLWKKLFFFFFLPHPQGEEKKEKPCAQRHFKERDKAIT
jgi:hypothetical protein